MSLYTVNPAVDLIHTHAGQAFCVKHFYDPMLNAHKLVLLVQQGNEWLANNILESDVTAAMLAGGAALYILSVLPKINAALRRLFGAVEPGDVYAALDAAFRAEFEYATGPDGVPQLQVKG